MSSTTNTTAFGPIEDGDLCAINLVAPSFPASTRLHWGTPSGRQGRRTIARARYAVVTITVLQETEQGTDIIRLEKDGTYEIKYICDEDGSSSIGITKQDEFCLIPSCVDRSRLSAYFTIADCGEQRSARYKLLDGQSVAFEVKAGKASQITGGESQISPPSWFTMQPTINDRIETLVEDR